jgi:RND superfamily putative drug exporter
MTTLAAVARFCYRRRRIVGLTWIVGVVALAWLGVRFGAAPDNDYARGDSDSARAQVLIERHFPSQRGDTLTLAIRPSGDRRPATRPRIERVIADLAASPITGPVVSPYDDRALVTADRRIARTTIPLTSVMCRRRT